MWKLHALCRQGDTLLCVVRWVHSENAAKPFSLAEVSLTETAVCWRDHATAEAARAEMDTAQESPVYVRSSAWGVPSRGGGACGGVGGTAASERDVRASTGTM